MVVPLKKSSRIKNVSSVKCSWYIKCVPFDDEEQRWPLLNTKSTGCHVQVQEELLGHWSASTRQCIRPTVPRSQKSHAQEEGVRDVTPRERPFACRP